MVNIRNSVKKFFSGHSFKKNEKRFKKYNLKILEVFEFSKTLVAQFIKKYTQQNENNGNQIIFRRLDLGIHLFLNVRPK